MMRLVYGGIRSGIGSIIGRMEKALTGTTDKEIDVSDFALKIRFKSTGKEFVTGVDVKYSSDPSKMGNRYSREGSKKYKLVDELEPLFAAKELDSLTYLLTNLYYHDSSSEEYSKYYNDIIALIKLTAGLRTLLPTNSGASPNFNNPSSVKALLLSDQRMFVLLNNKLFLMTTFLEAVYNSLFIGDIFGGLGRYRGILQNNLEKILKTLTDVGVLENGVPKGALYEDKMKFIYTDYMARDDQTGSAYPELKGIVDKKLGTKIFT
jgi:hypothetical protein